MTSARTARASPLPGVDVYPVRNSDAANSSIRPWLEGERYAKHGRMEMEEVTGIAIGAKWQEP